MWGAGPAYVKYNFVLRGCFPHLTSPFVSTYLDVACKGNSYPTTLHHICHGISKLSRLTRASKVYRAPGGRLPEAFFQRGKDENGLLGGVELGFMSTASGSGPRFLSPCANLLPSPASCD